MTRGRMAVALAALLAVFGAFAGTVSAGPLADATSQYLWDIELGGFLEFSSTINFNDPVDDANTLRIFDTDDSDLVDINMLQLYVDRLPEDLNDVGFRVDVAIGEDADIIGGDDSGIFSSGDSLNVYQAYVSYMAPIGNGLTIDIGRFATWHGYEVIESPLNDQFSRSFLFGLAIPFTHTGIRAGYDFNEFVGVSGGITQGWDTVEDNNDSFTFHGALYLNPTETISITNSFAAGPERDDGLGGANSDYTFLYDLVATWQFHEQMMVGANFDWANEERDGLGMQDAEWYGFGGYLRYDFMDRAYAAVRGEFFNDEDGVRTDPNGLNPAIAPGQGAEYWEITLTLGYEITDGLMGRLEYRHDDADEDVFVGDAAGVFESSQDTFAAELIYSF